MVNRQFDFEHQQFSIPEAAHHLRISRSFLYKLITAKAIRPTKLGARTIVSGAELSRFLQSTAERQTTPSTNAAPRSRA